MPMMFFSPFEFLTQIITLAIAGVVTVIVATFFGHTRILVAYMVLFVLVNLVVSAAFTAFGGLV